MASHVMTPAERMSLHSAARDLTDNAIGAVLLPADRAWERRGEGE
jgi:hypothetical protein